MKLEMFIDPAYYDMWCVKPVDMKDFGATLHFNTEKEAGYAKQSIEKWITKLSKREWVPLSDEDYDELLLSGDWGGSLIQATQNKLKEKNT